MEIKTLVLGLIKVNCYLVKGESGCVVIDPGFYDERILDFLKENADKQRLILITHAHFDHIGGALALSRETGVKIAIGKEENFALSDSDANLTARFRVKYEPFSADILLADNGEISVGDLNIKTIFTPGHTPGGVCYYINGTLFSGDTLFFETVGRTDFPFGNFKLLHTSIEKLFNLFGDETPVLSGHGQETSIGHEKENNPYY